MKTVQMTLDEDLVKAVDGLAKSLNTTRSAFTREALRQAIARYEVAKLESQHRKGYREYPVCKNEFDQWEEAQAWEL